MTPAAARLSCLSLAFGLLAVSACATIRSGSQLDETADLSTYRLWSWIADDPYVAPDGSAAFSPLTHSRIRDAIAVQLGIKGYRFDEHRAAADFVVAYTVDRDTEGTLSVDIFDAATRRPVWRGWAGKTITASDRRDPGPVIRDGVARLFESFPRSADYGPETF